MIPQLSIIRRATYLHIARIARSHVLTIFTGQSCAYFFRNVLHIDTPRFMRIIIYYHLIHHVYMYSLWLLMLFTAVKLFLNWECAGILGKQFCVVVTLFWIIGTHTLSGTHSYLLVTSVRKTVTFTDNVDCVSVRQIHCYHNVW